MKRVAASISIFLSIWLVIGAFCLHLFANPAQAASTHSVACMDFVEQGPESIQAGSTSNQAPNCCLDQNEPITGKAGLVQVQLLSLQPVDFSQTVVFSLENNQKYKFFTLNSNAPPGLITVGTTILRE